jgi:hypothetical protein
MIDLKSIPATVAQEAEAFLHQRALYETGERENAPGLSLRFIILADCSISPGSSRRGAIDADSYADVQRYLPRMLAKVGDPMDGAAILVGLYRNRCWQRCLDGLEGAYELANALLGFLAFSVHLPDVAGLATTDVLGILNEWLAPAKPWTALPGDFDACRHMFSAPWCDMTLQADCDGVDTTTQDSKGSAWFLVQTDMPPFLPGLCPAQEDVVAVDLPGLDWSE